jgi:two-component system, LytTR family, response regulator
MIHCLIIDDEQPAIDIIEDYVKEVPYLKLMGTTTNPVTGLSMVNAGGINLVFLDIHMPYLLGTDFVKAASGKCKIIFTTAHDKYALEGFEMDIIDYLLKPIPFPRFLKAVQKAQHILTPTGPLKKQEENAAPETYILLRGDTKGSYIKIELHDIDYVEATGNYVCVVCGTKKTIAHTTISAVEKLLPQPQFIRVQKSFIVNIVKIASITGNAIKLKNNDKADIVIGSTYKDAFLEIVRTRLADK